MGTVLLVEDDTLLLMALEDDLRRAGFSILTAPNADQAIDILEDHPEVSVMFTDIDMPGSMDGLRLAAAVRDRWPPIKIVVTSGHKQPDPASLPDGIFLRKPVPLGHLVETLGRYA